MERQQGQQTENTPSFWRHISAGKLPVFDETDQNSNHYLKLQALQLDKIGRHSITTFQGQCSNSSNDAVILSARQALSWEDVELYVSLCLKA